MRFWQYFNAGAEIIILYSNASFSSGLKRVSEFMWASKTKVTSTETSLSSTKRGDIQ